MRWYAKKRERSQMMGLWEIIKMQKFALPNQNRKNLLIKEIRTMSTFFKF